MPDNVYAALEQAVDTGPAGSSPVHLLERGEMSPADFEARLARALTEQGSPVEAAGLLDRMLGGLARLDDDMAAVVSRARGSGIRTALLSNSWGDHYPEQLWDGMFDAVVISGRVGMRKPDAAIYVHTADAIGLVPAQCVMVDDLPHNVERARASGMVGVLHHGFAQTLTELQSAVRQTAARRGATRTMARWHDSTSSVEEEAEVADRLSPLDVSFLYLEEPTTPMHVGSVMIFEPPAGGLDVEAASCATSGPGSRFVPRYRQRVRWVPGRLANPVWVDDEQLRHQLPRPPLGAAAARQRRAAAASSSPGCRPAGSTGRRPLWELIVVEGLADGRVASSPRCTRRWSTASRRSTSARCPRRRTGHATAPTPHTWHPVRPSRARSSSSAGALADSVRRPSRSSRPSAAGLGDARGDRGQDASRPSAGWPSPPPRPPGRAAQPAQPRHHRAPPVRDGRHRPGGLPADPPDGRQGQPVAGRSRGPAAIDGGGGEGDGGGGDGRAWGRRPGRAGDDAQVAPAAARAGATTTSTTSCWPRSPGRCGPGC